MNTPARARKLFLGDDEHEDFEVPQGFVSLRSVKSPAKTTPNEDASAVIPLDNGSLVAAVADGVGGTPLGREASRLAVQHLHRALTSQAVTGESLRTAIFDAVERANRAVLEIGRGAATTLVIAELTRGKLRSYHVGDSELIAVGQRGRMKLRVIPHSPTGFAVEAGLLDEDEAVHHDQRHIIFNVIGAPDMRVEIGPPVELAVRDTVLLATDGLLDNLFMDEIVDTIRIGPLPAAADRLVELAGERMSGAGAGPSKPDDLTVVLFRPRVSRRSPAARRRTNRLAGAAD